MEQAVDSLYMAERCNDNRNPNSVLRMEDFLMYINITGSKDNKDVYIT